MGKAKKRIVKAQRTTTKRSQITVAQQYRWFKKYQEGLNFLREKNTGICRKPGRYFGEVLQHFIIGGEKKCLMDDAYGDVKIVGKAKKSESREYYLSSLLSR